MLVSDFTHIHVRQGTLDTKGAGSDRARYFSEIFRLENLEGPPVADI